MNPTRLLILIVFLSLAAAAVWKFSSQPAPPVEEVPPVQVSEDPLLDGNPDDIQRITIHHTNVERMVRLVRGEFGEWKMTEPLVDFAEPSVVRSALSLLYGKQWKPAPEGWQQRPAADLGLDPPSLTVELDLKNGGPTRVLEIGVATLNRNFYAARLDGRLIRLGAALGGLLARKPDQWRDRRMIRTPMAVHRLEFKPQQGTGMVLVRKGDLWYMERPLKAPLSPLARSAVARLLGARTEILAEEVIRPEMVKAAQSSDKLWVYARGEKRVISFLSGAVYVSDRPYVLPLPMEIFDLFRQDPEKLRSPFLVDFEPRHIASLMLGQGEREMVFRRRAAGWSGPGGVFLPEDHPQQPGDPLEPIFGQLVEGAATLKFENPQAVPDRPADGFLRLSKSANPIERGSVQLQWWLDAEGRPWVAELGGEVMVASDMPLDAWLQRCLLRFPQQP
ncbi:MAG: DUF4340 domain-containing protein [Planctomycetota bacterium]|nr:MAG: DUF4340 domain-containing protein [Planctomycetota bacterium]